MRMRNDQKACKFVGPCSNSLPAHIGLAPRRSPEVGLAYNRLAFEDCTAAASGDAAAFAPFVAESEAQRPGLHLGFSLPAGRTFLNTTISLYNRVAESKYGERAVPRLSGRDPSNSS